MPLYLALITLAALAIFQVALIAGAPLGRFAWGGQHTLLPTKLRGSSVIAIVLYAVFAMILLERSGVTQLVPSLVDHSAAWVLVAYLVLATLMNLVSKSRSEKLVMTPVSAVLLVCTVLVALG